MGLDMYLSKRIYVGNNYRKPENQVKIVIPEDQGDALFPLKPNLINQSRITYIKEDVMYWRKVNAIHQWFVENCQNGVDDCGSYDVSREQLEILITTCKEVIKHSKLVAGEIVESIFYKEGEQVPNMIEGMVIEDSSTAERLLPCQSGFFFGSTEYDEHYLQNLKDTVRQLEKELSESDNNYFIYHSSW